MKQSLLHWNMDIFRPCLPNKNLLQLSLAPVILHLPVAPVSEWRDNESAGIPEVLIPIRYCSCDHPDLDTLVLIVIPQLTDPLEVLRVTHLRLV